MLDAQKLEKVQKSGNVAGSAIKSSRPTMFDFGSVTSFMSYLWCAIHPTTTTYILRYILLPRLLSFRTYRV